MLRSEKGKLTPIAPLCSRSRMKLTGKQSLSSSYSARTEMKACSRVHSSPLPEMQNLPDTSQEALLCCMLWSISIWDRGDMGEQKSSQQDKKLSNADHGFLYYKTGY